MNSEIEKLAIIRAVDHYVMTDEAGSDASVETYSLLMSEANDRELIVNGISFWAPYSDFGLDEMREHIEDLRIDLLEFAKIVLLKEAKK